MKKRIGFLILTVIMLISIAISAAGESSDLDHQLVYDMELQSVKVDLTNEMYLRDAIGNLQTIGAYKFAKSYVQYFQAVLEMISGQPDLKKARIRIESCMAQADFSADLLEQGFPACEVLLKYVDARVLEEQGRWNEAHDKLAEVGVILDATDRLFDLKLRIADAASVQSEESTPKPINSAFLITAPTSTMAVFLSQAEIDAQKGIVPCFGIQREQLIQNAQKMLQDPTGLVTYQNLKDFPLLPNFNSSSIDTMKEYFGKTENSFSGKVWDFLYDLDTGYLIERDHYRDRDTGIDAIAAGRSIISYSVEEKDYEIINCQIIIGLDEEWFMFSFDLTGERGVDVGFFLSNDKYVEYSYEYGSKPYPDCQLAESFFNGF